MFTLQIRCKSCGKTNTFPLAKADGDILLCDFCEKPFRTGALEQQDEKYEDTVKKHQWRSVAIHRVVSLARASRDFNELVDREFEHCIGDILRANFPGDAKEAMKNLVFKVRKYTDYSDFAKHIMTNFTEID